MELNGKLPNFLIILVDQERFPPPYETGSVTTFRQEQLVGREAIRQYGLDLEHHYVASTACAPSRTSIFTGHYPSLHGVSQTDGLYKRPGDPDMFWLEQNTIPTMGNYFRAAGYRTFYKGKWHVSQANLPETSEEKGEEGAWNKDGSQTADVIEQYRRADPLDVYGFSGWIGPEPHGSLKVNTGVNRDAGFAEQTVALLDQLEQEYQAGKTAPWLAVASFLNPHDIALFGLLWTTYRYRFVDGSIPNIPSAPTRKEDLSSKPGCQQSYIETYGRLFLPQPTLRIYRRFYYYLHKLVDSQIARVYNRLKASVFFENTIVIFTSDHGEMLGAHGGMHQKWHNAYEETVHVPLIFSNPLLFPKPAALDIVSNHVDLLPTLLGMAGLDAEELRKALSHTHRQVEPPVGRDLSRWILGKETPNPNQIGPVYFMTDDEISEGQNHRRVLNAKAIRQPNHIETVIAPVPDEEGGQPQLWKYSRYFDNPEFWTQPNRQDESSQDGKTILKTAPLPDEFELYNLSTDQLEQTNLAAASNRTPATESKRKQLEHLLNEQRNQKRLSSGSR